MAGFAFRFGPSVRVAKLSRGVRVSVGPRMARVHLGAGTRPTVSTGIGPVTAWEGIPSSHRRGGPQTAAQRATAHSATVRRRSRAGVVVSLLLTLVFAAIGALCFWLASFGGGVGPHWAWALGGAGFGGLVGHVLFAVEHEIGGW